MSVDSHVMFGPWDVLILGYIDQHLLSGFPCFLAMPIISMLIPVLTLMVAWKFSSSTSQRNSQNPLRKRNELYGFIGILKKLRDKSIVNEN